MTRLSHNRTPRADENTALLFVYCELLIKLEDEAKIKSEKTRLASLAPEMDILGEAHRGLWDDMCADAFNDLFDRLAAWIGKPDADKKLEAYFDDDEANHTLYGLRVSLLRGPPRRVSNLGKSALCRPCNEEGRGVLRHVHRGRRG